MSHWLYQRATAAILFPTLLFADVSILIVLNLVLFWHMQIGIQEILSDYIHNEVTRECILVLLRILILVIMKYVFVLYVL
uniref:Succinate:cytochrome c oxidoreductase subunit 4 n=1 Tax=Chaetosphaeridium globosum TaxID=96477 RepID=Q8M1H0_CHAGL|nr:succinate:cytochrome c oxidoreductase subunit 4 [Chaetosphaeridium globosum]AAM96629.1 succinate:cytochrome c oxidoreductase subunit 4 [Chaetosphaeridium globosum]